MTNWLNAIFGGGSSASSSSNQSSSLATNMNPFTSLLEGNLTSLFNQGPMQYTGNLQPTMTTAQGTSLSNLATMADPSNSANSWINSVLGGQYMPGGALGNSYLSNAITAANTPVSEALATTLGQTLPSQFAASGQQVQGSKISDVNGGGRTGGTSAFTNAAALATQSAANAMANTASTLTENAYNQGVQQQTAAANLQPQEVNSAINVLQAQLLPTLLQQQGISNGLQAFQDNVNSFTSFLSTMTSAATPVVGYNSQSTGTSTSASNNYGNGIWSDLFSSGSGGGSSSTGNFASMLAALLSSGG